MIRCKNHERLSAAIKDTVPLAAGVYIFKDRHDRTIYIGKSIKLRDRMLSYLRQDFDTVDARIGQLIHSIETFEYFTTETELQALLLEDCLIKKELPEYNIRQKQFEENRYLLLTRDAYPTLLVIDNPEREERGVVFGPFRDRYFVSDLLDVIYQYFPIRGCTEPTPNRKCLNYDVARCAGPCRNTISIDSYQNVIRRVQGFLEGRSSRIVEGIREEMEAAAGERLYEKAEKCNKRLKFCARFVARQEFIRNFTCKSLILKENNSDASYRFDKGRWVKGRGKIVGSAGTAYRLSEDRDFLRQDPRFVVDRANIIYAWIHSRKTECEHHFLS